MSFDEDGREIDDRQPEFCCKDCGDKYGGEMKGWPQYHMGVCDACNAVKVPVTTPSWWGMFTKGWELL